MSHTTVVSECSATDEFKQKANRLKSLLKHLNPTPSLSDCLEYLSKLEKARDWNTMKARLEQQAGGVKTPAPVLRITPEQGQEKKELSVLSDLDFYTEDPEKMAHAVKKFYSRILRELIDKAATKEAFLAQTSILPIKSSEHPVPALVEKYSIDSYCNAGNCETSFKLIVMPHAIEIMDVETELFFPKSCRKEALRLLDSEVMCESMKPSLTHGKNWEEEDGHIVTFKGTSISSFSEPGKTVFDDPQAVLHFQERLKEVLAGLRKIHDAFNDLAGSWGKSGQGNFFEKVENAIWDDFSGGQPRYMAGVDEFYTLEVEGQTFKAEMAPSGPIVRKGNNWVQIESCSVAFEPGNRDDFWIVKHENEPRISLEGLSSEAVATLVEKFGLPVSYMVATALDLIGEEQRREMAQYKKMSSSEAFRQVQSMKARIEKLYGSNAFKGLRTWVEKYPLKAKKLSENSSAGWLSDWHERATQKG